MNNKDFEELKRILDLMPCMPLIGFSETNGGWHMDDNTVYWTHDGEEFSEEIYEAHTIVGDYMIVNLRLSTGCTETNIFSIADKSE